MRSLDIGCGINKRGTIGVDIAKKSKADVIANTEIGLPFQDSTFDKIYCYHYLEHTHDLVKVMEEIWRVAKPRALVEIESPHFSSHQAYRDPTHTRFFTTKTMNYFEKEHKLGYYSSARFRVRETKLVFGDFSRAPLFWRPFMHVVQHFANANPNICERFWCYLVGGFETVRFVLEADKEEVEKKYKTRKKHR